MRAGSFSTEFIRHYKTVIDAITVYIWFQIRICIKNIIFNMRHVKIGHQVECPCWYHGTAYTIFHPNLETDILLYTPWVNFPAYFDQKEEVVFYRVCRLHHIWFRWSFLAGNLWIMTQRLMTLKFSRIISKNWSVELIWYLAGIYGIMSLSRILAVPTINGSGNLRNYRFQRKFSFMTFYGTINVYGINFSIKHFTNTSVIHPTKLNSPSKPRPPHMQISTKAILIAHEKRTNA